MANTCAASPRVEERSDSSHGSNPMRWDDDDDWISKPGSQSIEAQNSSKKTNDRESIVP
jgi:hypothetical protein